MSAFFRSPEGLTWEPVLEGAEMAVLYGDPTAAGFYVIRFRTDREIHVPLHWHRTDEHFTVIQGPFQIAVGGEAFDVLEPGTYGVVPVGVHHASVFGCGTMVQVSGLGPFESIYVDPAEALGERIGNQGGHEAPF